MPRSWEEDFDFYMSQMGGDPLGVMVDLGAARHVPVETHNVRLRLMVRMKNPQPDGLRSREESAELFALEDQLCDTLGERLDALMVGRVIVHGITDVVFYAPGTAVGQLETLRELVDQVRGDYEIDIDVTPDALWEFYREVLWPDTYEHQFIMSNRVLRQLEQAGDDPAVARAVDHLVFLPDRDAADKAAAGLRDAGFTIPDPRQDDDGSYRIDFQDETTLDDGRIHERVAAILDVVLPLEGSYDGWGCMVMEGKSERN
jgi:regulator of RNase E activity RraB